MSLSNGHFIHTTIDGDRWDLLAHRYYGDASKQHVLVQANTALFINPVRVPPAILSAGLKLIVPVIEADQVNDAELPPWKRAEASYA